MATSIAQQATTAAPMPARRRAGWVLVAAVASFVVALIVTIADVDYQNAMLDASRAADTPMMAVPAAEQARVAQEHMGFLNVVSGILLLIPFAALAYGMYHVRRHESHESTASLTSAAFWLGIGMAGFWYFYALLSAGLYLGPDRMPPLVAQIDVLGAPIVTAAALCGCGAVLAAGLAFRRLGVTPRAALAAVIISALLIVIGVVTVVASGFALDLPPIAPFLPALILGIGLLRHKDREGELAA